MVRAQGDKSRPPLALSFSPSDHHHPVLFVSHSLYDLLCSVAFEKSTFIPGCQKRNHDLTSQRKHVLQGHSTFIIPHGPALSTISEVPKQDPLSLPTRDTMTPAQTAKAASEPLVWDWALEHADRKKEARADAAVHGAPPFQVDRKLLKDIVHEKMDAEVARITFLGAGVYPVTHSVSRLTDASPRPNRHIPQGMYRKQLQFISRERV